MNRVLLPYAACPATISLTFRTKLGSLVHDLIAHINNKSKTDVIFIYFANPFDVVPHSRLITNFCTINLSPTAECWIDALVSTRLECCFVNDMCCLTPSNMTNFKWLCLIVPLIFLAFINNFRLNLPVYLSFCKDWWIHRAVHHFYNALRTNMVTIYAVYGALPLTLTQR